MKNIKNIKNIKLSGDAGVSGWLAILNQKLPSAELEDDITADWLIVGGGFAGLSAAKRLQELHPKDRIAVVEAFKIGEGPAGRNSGFMIDLPHNVSSDNYAGAQNALDLRQIKLNRVGINFAKQIAAEYQFSQQTFHQAGKTNGAAGEKGHNHNIEYAHYLNELGETSKKLDAKDMRELTGSDYYQSGLYTSGTVMVQPAAYITGLAAGLLKNRVMIYQNSAVKNYQRQGNDWRVTTAKGSITAPKIILAVNGQVERFGFYQRRLMHIILYASMTRPLSSEQVQKLGGQAEWGVTPSNPIGSTIRRIMTAEGVRLVIRNQSTYAPSMEVNSDILGKRQKRHTAGLKARFPQLHDIAMEYSWSGRLCLSLNDASAFGQLDHGLFSACCQNGLGTVRGTLSGMLAAEMAAGQNNPLIPILCETSMPKMLPPEPFATIGAKAVMTYKEFSAGREL